MSQNPGWLQRMFGGRDAEEALSNARNQLNARDHRIAELERELLVAHEATGASERERELAEKLALAIADRTTLAAELAELNKRLVAHESALASELERATTLGKAATAANRRAEQRMLELQAIEKQRIETEAGAASAKAALEQLEATCAARERELSAKSDALTGAEWKIETLERELEQARVELQRAKNLQQSSAALQRELASQRAEREQQDRALSAAQAAEARLAGELVGLCERDSARQVTLRRVIELSAHALHQTLGATAHLALELGAARVSAAALAGPSEQDVLRQLSEQLALLGVVDELSASREGDQLQCRLRLRGVSEPDALVIARWVAAYAIELLGVGAPLPLRLETLTGGPSEFRFSASPRAAAPRPRALPSSARELLTESELSPTGG